MSDSVNEKLQQLVFDENKIITYKSLTRLLQINVNLAKKNLQDFFDSNREELNASYILIGVQKNENEKLFTKILLASADEVEQAKTTFVKVISCHIYCIHKGQLTDKLAIYTADCEGQSCNQGLNEFSAVKNSHVRVESRKRNIKSATAAVPIRQEKKLPQAKVENGDAKQAQKNDSISPPATKPTRENEGSKGLNSKSKNSNIFSMFQKKQGEKKVNDSKSVQKVDSANSNGKETEKTDKKQSPKSEPKDKKDIKNLFSKQITKGTKLLPDQNVEVKVSPTKTNRNQSKSTKQKRGASKQKKKSDDDSDEESLKPKKKKHKRIVQVEDSDSESENEELMDKAQRELVQCEPDISTLTVPSALNDNLSEDDDSIPPTPISDGKKRKWKTVTKTFMDANGFFVTKKTKEYATASEESDNEDTKKSKSPIASEPVKKASFANKKQASLMSFFGKK